ncbi:hypothetical protein [Dokdonia sp. Hel_I_53]|uniref:hypothetical protein n=1 Tax=Dokdonia sp. Hel_I_53 TaxID=1566287 RepID=UPI001199EFD3|nr:hypothetical protein [Dokdonia sp. Hel_I_53]TVZ52966.1 hypothetical protein OD90_2156 [Dokdonia sp. Hel_I_53]
MKLQKVAIAALILVGLSFTSCRETETKETTVVREVEVETSDDDGGILERTAKKVDDEVNKEINEEIEKIGDDN